MALSPSGWQTFLGATFHMTLLWRLFDNFNVTGRVCGDLWNPFIGFYESGDADRCVVVFHVWRRGEVVSVVAPNHDSEPVGVWVGLADVEKCWLSSTVRCVHGADCGAGDGCQLTGVRGCLIPSDCIRARLQRGCSARFTR